MGGWATNGQVDGRPTNMWFGGRRRRRLGNDERENWRTTNERAGGRQTDDERAAGRTTALFMFPAPTASAALLVLMCALLIGSRRIEAITALC